MNGSGGVYPARRRRGWYRRRLRIRRALLTATMVLAIAAACWQSVARHWSLPTLHTSTLLPESFWTRGDVHKKLALMAHPGARRGLRAQDNVYPYSVIPGGVRDVADLREHAARDYVVRRHFAGFNFNRARLVRAGKAREVYLSYRIRDRVFWTRRRVRLLESELLLTDGVITARARCGNQISGTPKAEVSDEEPATDVLDQPVGEVAALGPPVPIRFGDVHPNLPGADGLPPSGPLLSSGFNFPWVDFGTTVSKTCKPGEKDKRCHHHNPPAVPEPGTLALFGTGLALVTWRYRRRLARSPQAA